MWCFKDNKRVRKTPNVHMEIIFPILILIVVKLEIRVWGGVLCDVQPKHILEIFKMK